MSISLILLIVLILILVGALPTWGHIDILPVMNGGDSHYWTAMPDRIGLRRLIQQNAYLSDSHKGRRITGDFCARFQLPDGKKY